MENLFRRLMLGGSAAAIMATGPAILNSAAAQDATAPPTPETVVVTGTGTSIRGVESVGSDLITMDQKTIEDTGGFDVGQILADSTAIEGFGNSGLAPANSSNGGPGIAIYIHQLGANGSGSTLVLVDGHRVTESGVTNYFVDPNLVPTNMIQRIDVLAEGASSVYGSDAVAGVVNFITRQGFEGVQLSGQVSFAQGTSSYQAGVLAGHAWDHGSVVLGVTYEKENQLLDTSRWWTNPLAQTASATAAGLPVTNPNSTSTNFGNFNCGPASIQPSGKGNIYLNAQSATNVSNAQANAFCSAWPYGAILPNAVRYNSMIKFAEDIGPVTTEFDLIVDERTSNQVQSRGTLTATAFGTGAQANPFYTNPPGVTGTNQTIRMDFDQLLGPGAILYGGDLPITANGSADWHINDNWDLDLAGVAGRDDAYTGSIGTINQPLALLALNGTTSTGGSTTATSIPGYNTVTLNLPLTTANALDVWNPAGSNLTSPSVLQAIESNNKSVSHGVYGVQDLKATAQGTLFSTGAGPIKIAFGAEQLNTQIEEFGTKAGGAAGANVDSQYFDYHFGRRDTAEFVEMNIPLVSSSMDIPLMKKFEVDLSLRHDDYSDFGATTNPKGSFNWDVIDGLRLRGNWSTSFVAPPLNLVGGSAGLANFSSVSGATGGGPIPVSLYPLVTQMGIPGCTASSTTCNISTLQGISRSIGDPNAKAAKGRGWTAGFDFAPDFIPGLETSVTYWDTELLGGMTGPPFNISVTNSTLINHLTLYPNCATPAEITAYSTSLGGQPIPQSSVFPSCTQFTYEGLTSNFYYMYAAGVDAQIAYTLDIDRYGDFTVGENLTQTTKFNVGYSFGQAPAPSQIFSTLGSDGINTSFPTIATASRSHLGWANWGINTDLYMNWTSAYKNVGSPVTPIVDNSQAIWNGQGGDHVDANITFDLHLAYNFNDGILGNDTISGEITDLLGSRAPYYNSSTGYDSTVANPIGRTFVLSLKSKF